VRPALLFDLDETLMVEEPAAVAAFEATAQFATSRCEIDPASLATGARLRARELWYAAPTHDYCARVGISSWEGLWCRFEGEGPDERALRDWSPTYRREAWSLALADQGVDDPRLAEELGKQFGVERRARHEVFADAERALAELGESYSLGLLTNGAACLQREKLAASGLVGYFDAVVVSADIGAAKPDVSVFERALSQLGAERENAVMVGDSLAKDIDGATAAGLGAIWVNRTGAPAPSDREDLLEITTLEELPSALSISTSKEAPPPDP
jgi:putative hydrolase of the HAD superfamily